MRLASLLTLFLCLGAVAAPATPRYNVQILPILPTALNNKGHIVGSWKRPHSTIQTAVLYINGRIVDLDPKDKFDPVFHSRKTISAESINDRDEVIGSRWASAAITSVHGFYWAKGAIRQLDANEGWGGCCAVAINNRGEMVGWADGNYAEDMGSDAVYWKSGTVAASNLGKKMGWRHSEACDINNHGDIVGKWQDVDDKWHAFLLSGGHITNIQLPGSDSELFEATVDDKQQVVGVFFRRTSGSPTAQHSFVWHKGRLRDLGRVQTNQARPVLWSEGRYWDLNAIIPHGSGVRIGRVIAINDRGDIAATGSRRGKPVGLVLQPIRRSASTKSR